MMATVNTSRDAQLCCGNALVYKERAGGCEHVDGGSPRYAVHGMWCFSVSMANVLSSYVGVSQVDGKTPFLRKLVCMCLAFTLSQRSAMACNLGTHSYHRPFTADNTFNNTFTRPCTQEHHHQRRSHHYAIHNNNQQPASKNEEQVWTLIRGIIKEDAVPFFDIEAARLVTIAATTASGLTHEHFVQQLQELLLLIPGFQARLQRIRPQLLAALVCDTAGVADKMVVLKNIFPQADVAQLVCKR